MVFAGVAAGLALLAKQEIGAACCLLLAFTVVMKAVLRHSVWTFFAAPPYALRVLQ
jgi:hypothetical protein